MKGRKDEWCEFDGVDWVKSHRRALTRTPLNKYELANALRFAEFRGILGSGECFRSGSVWELDNSRVFCFRAGHETFPAFEDADALKVFENDVGWLSDWCARPGGRMLGGCIWRGSD